MISDDAANFFSEVSILGETTKHFHCFLGVQTAFLPIVCRSFRVSEELRSVEDDVWLIGRDEEVWANCYVCAIDVFVKRRHFSAGSQWCCLYNPAAEGL